MGKKENQIFQALMAQIQSLQNQPKPVNLAQERLTNESIKGSNWLAGRDFRNMKDAGMFFDFEQPAEQNRRRTQITNAFQGGTFGMADNAGETQATQLQGKYLGDKFARDTASNFQSNIQQAGQNVRSGLVESSGAIANENALEQSRRLAALSSLTSMYGKPKDPGILGSIIGAGASIGSAAITHGGF